MPAPTAKEMWIVGFVDTLLLDARRDIGRKFANLAANNEWPRSKHLPPEQAAKQWLERLERAHRPKRA